MKKLSTLIILLSSIYSLGQTVENEKVSYSDGITNIRVSQIQDILLGYPTANELKDKAVDYYNDGTNFIYSDPEKAAALLKKSIQIEPTFVQAYDNLGKTYRILEKFDTAIKYYKASSEIFPNGPTAHQNLAVVYDKQNKYELAISEYKKLIEIDVNNPEGYYGLGNIYYKYTDEYEIALINTKKALELYEKNPPNYIGDCYKLVGLIYYYMDNKKQARIYIQLAKEKYIENDFKEIFYQSIPKDILEELLIN